MADTKFSGMDKQKSTSLAYSCGVLPKDDMFRIHPPAEGEREKLDRQVKANRRSAQMGLQLLPSHILDLVTDVFWFDQTPTDVLLCGHA